MEIIGGNRLNVRQNLLRGSWIYDDDATETEKAYITLFIYEQNIIYKRSRGGL